MKRLIYGTLFLATVGIGLDSCQKENVSPANRISNELSSSYKGVFIENGMVNFSNLDSYYAIVNDEDPEVRVNFAAYLGSLGMNNYFNEKNVARDVNAKQEMDDFFGQVLNEDGCVKIGGHIYRVDLLNERVLVVENKLWSELKSSFLSDRIDKKIQIHSFDDDVLSVVNDPTYAGEKCSNVSSFNIPSTGMPTNSSYKFKTTLKLFKAGIYSRVTARTERLGSVTDGFRYKLRVTYNTAKIKRKPCKNNSSTNHSVGIKLNTYNNSNAVWEAYSKSWNVKSIYMYVYTEGQFGKPSDDGNLLGNSPVIGVNL